MNLKVLIGCLLVVLSLAAVARAQGVAVCDPTNIKTPPCVNSYCDPRLVGMTVVDKDDQNVMICTKKHIALDAQGQRVTLAHIWEPLPLFDEYGCGAETNCFNTVNPRMCKAICDAYERNKSFIKMPAPQSPIIMYR